MSALMAQIAAAATLSDKVACLSRPDTYLEPTTAVEIVETHMSYVFMTDTYVYKLKKPVRYPFLDFSTLEARRRNCEQEVRLNRRLARNVYLGVIPLVRSDTGLRLLGEGEPVEWLVKMRRLPRHLMLDQAIREARVSEQDIARFTRVLANFYQTAVRENIAPAVYRAQIRTSVLDDHRALSRPAYELDETLLDSICSAQLDFLESHAADFDARVTQRLIVEGHGDLRPEHVCLAAEPVFIDCLEFNRELRIVDPADELGYLAMECEFAGAAHIGHTIFETYSACTGDRPPAALVRLHQSRRAVLRAKLAAGHLDDHLTNGAREAWRQRARSYLSLSQLYCAIC